MNILLFLLLTIAPIADINKIAEINRLKKEAKEAYINGDYQEAIAKYNTLIGAYGVQDERVRLNLSHAYYKNNDLPSAFENYSQLLTSGDPRIRSTAFNQMGLIADSQQKTEEALNYFKEALKADPANEEARYNYTMLKKKREEQQQDQEKEKQEQEDQEQQEQENKDQQGEQDKQEEKGEDQESKEEGDQEEEEQENQGESNQSEEQQESEEQEETDQIPQSTADKLEEMNISEEKAKMILEAMKNSEIQYLQQNQRKARSKADSGKPDW